MPIVKHDDVKNPLPKIEEKGWCDIESDFESVIEQAFSPSKRGTPDDIVKDLTNVTCIHFFKDEVLKLPDVEAVYFKIVNNMVFLWAELSKYDDETRGRVYQLQKKMFNMFEDFNFNFLTFSSDDLKQHNFVQDFNVAKKSSI